MTSTSRSMITAMLCAAAVTAEFVSGKATRDSLFLTSLDITALPTMLIATSVCSLLLVAAQARAVRKISPAVLVPASFVASGVLFLCEWLLRSTAPSATAVIVYLHVSGAGPLLASGFWLIASERFNPRTAKKGFGRVAGAGTLGGLLGALLAERVGALLGVPSMLLFLAAFQFVTAWLVRMLAVSAEATVPPASVDAVPSASTTPLRAGLRVIAQAPHLRHLMALVLLGTTSAALLDYLFKAKAVETFGPGDGLLRFFALYYAATSLISFILQTLGSRPVLERFGLALTTSTPSIALLAGSIGGLVAPGFGSLLVARGGESIFRASWFRAGYELFYTPIPAAEKRAAKPLIDVALDRMGDAVGGGLVRLAVVFVPVAQSSTILSLAMVSSIGAIIAASHLNRWHLRTLERSLVNQAGGLDLTETNDGSTANVLLSMQRRNAGRPTLRQAPSMTAPLARTNSANSGEISHTAGGPVVQDILSLLSGNRERAISVLSRQEELAAGLVPHVIPLLASDRVADYAMVALRKVAEERVGELTDALLDSKQDYAVRSRLARVFSVCASQRAAEALVLALDDPRFDVRFQAARSLAAILKKNPRVLIVRERIEEVVLREMAVSQPIWESRRLLDGFASESPLANVANVDVDEVDEFVKDRASQSLAHVFTLLSLVLPREPLQIAFRSLHGDDKQLRGTALEYLEGVLPAPIRQRLWPFLVRRRTVRPAQPREEIFADLLRSNPSITLVNIAGKLGKPSMAASASV